MTAHQIAPFLSPGHSSSLLLVNVCLSLSSESLLVFQALWLWLTVLFLQLPCLLYNARSSTKNSSYSTAIHVCFHPLSLLSGAQLSDSKLCLLWWDACIVLLATLSQCFPLRTSCLFVLMGFHTLILQFSSSLLHLYKDNQSTPAAVHWPPYRSPLLNSHTIIAVLLLFIHCMSVVRLFLYLCQPEVLLWICCYSFIRKKWWGMWSSVATLALATVK